MKPNNAARTVAGCLALLLGAATVARGEEVEKKWRVSASIGNYDNRPQVGSDAANILVIETPERDFLYAYVDPRDDSTALGVFSIRPAFRVAVAAQYAFSRIGVIEGSVGYQKGDVGNIELQAQFDGVRPPTDRIFAFTPIPVKAGTMTQVPIQITALLRFRPKASLNPYIGLGAGYIFVGFKPSSELDQLSRNMELSVGQATRMAQYPGGIGSFLPAQALAGARVEAPGSWEWHMVTGMEYTFHRKWAVFADLRYQTAARSFFLGFNNSDSLGVSVPNRTAQVGSIYDLAAYGPMNIVTGGLVDAGRLVPTNPADPPEVCSTDVSRCTFEFKPDGVLDKGLYYVKGGRMRYNGALLAVGVRFTF